MISPAVGFRSLINIRKVVVLPAPFAPKKHQHQKQIITKMMKYLIVQNKIVSLHENLDDPQLYIFDDALIFLFVF